MTEKDKPKRSGYPFRPPPSLLKKDDEEEEKKDRIDERKSPPKYNVYKK